jgi:hypothetical protein
MRRTAAPAALLAVLLTVLAVTFFVVTPSMSQPRTTFAKHEVILMRCEPKGGGFTVTNYSSSQSAPTRTTDNCAEALSINDRNGFVIVDILRFDSGGGYIVYTLAR